MTAHQLARLADLLRDASDWTADPASKALFKTARAAAAREANLLRRAERRQTPHSQAPRGAFAG